MQFTVEQIRSVRNNYLEKPYPNFSLEEVCRRRRGAQTKLVRGEKAWQAKGSAQSTEEWVARKVQGSLNKMSARNFNQLVAELKTKELFATKEILTNVVSIIFQKALDEPENSKLYAGVCFQLAVYEVSISDTAEGERPNSELRNAVVSKSQNEFKNFRIDNHITEGMSQEEVDLAQTNFMRRKRANIRFVGELYLSDVLSNSTIFVILGVIMEAAMAGGCPPSENIELLAELFQTIGERLDKQQRKFVDHYFELLADFVKRADNPYPHRIRFKIMDLLDLRKTGWGTKLKGKASGSTATKKLPSGTPSSPTSKKAATLDKSWRDQAAKPASLANAATSSTKVTNSAAASPSPKAQEPAAPLVKFDLRVQALFREWVGDVSNDFIPQWINEFNNCDRTFQTAEELCIAVAMEVIKEACTTTRKEAQREACSFLIVGLFLMDCEMFAGLAGALAAAIEDGLLEDVPKFSERFMHMLRLTSSEEEEVNANVYYDAANVLRMTYNQLSYVDESTVDTLMGFWSKVPVPEADDSEPVILNFQVLYTLCDDAGAKNGLELFLCRIVDSLHQMGIVEGTTIEEMLTSEAPGNPLFTKMVAEYKRVKNIQ